MEKVMSKPEVKKYYYRNGNVEMEGYYINGKLHREYGPAYIEYYESGNIKYEAYYINGLSHREDGPAVIWYYADGNIQRKLYYLNGERLIKEEWYSKLTTEQKVNLLYGIDNE
jgi:antitoxin component YwqK of YwqJK toxin-antitoxin module